MNTDFQNTRATIAGMGRSGLACAELLHRAGAQVFVTDSGDAALLADARSRLEALSIENEAGGHTDRAIDSADIVVLSPGVPANKGIAEEGKRRGKPVVSELEIASRFCEAPIIAVTGTNGKTTVTEWVHHCLQAVGIRSSLTGNNATPLSAAVMENPSPDCFVVEASSYALESIDTFHPVIGALLNISADHMARHQGVLQYAAAKGRMFQNMTANDTAILNADDDTVISLCENVNAEIVRFAMMPAPGVDVWDGDGAIQTVDGDIALRDAIPLPGTHNIANALAVTAILRAWGAPIDPEVFASFKGVPHRIEFVADVDGVKYYNDSKATNIESLLVALNSFEAPIVLIAGGEGKGTDYSVVTGRIMKRLKKLIVLGADAEKMEVAWGSHIPFKRADDMAGAVHMAAESAAAGDVVLLSPACASFDRYKNFEERGDDFKSCVQQLQAGILS